MDAARGASARSSAPLAQSRIVRSPAREVVAIRINSTYESRRPLAVMLHSTQ